MEKQTHTKLWFIIITLTLLTGMLAYSGIRNGGVNQTGSKGTASYSTLKEAQEKTSLDLTLPDNIDTSEILEIRSVMGQIVEIRAEHYVLKAAILVDVKADPLGLYDKADTDSMYTVSSSDISFFRYRVGYPEYEQCTLVNWCNQTTAIGIMFDEVFTEEQVLAIMGIDKSVLSVYSSDDSQETVMEDTAVENWQTIKLTDSVSISLPETECEVKSVDLGGYTILFLNENRCLVVVYSDYAIDTDVFSGQGQIDIDEHTRLNYLLANEFEVDTAENRDYTLILNNIDEIASSITRN